MSVGVVLPDTRDLRTRIGRHILPVVTEATDNRTINKRLDLSGPKDMTNNDLRENGTRSIVACGHISDLSTNVES
jgi:hypothetical protein